jgi:hypothetical protein
VTNPIFRIWDSPIAQKHQIIIGLSVLKPRRFARKDEKQGELINNKETVEKPVSERLMENVQMQGFRNPEE